MNKQHCDHCDCDVEVTKKGCCPNCGAAIRANYNPPDKLPDLNPPQKTFRVGYLDDIIVSMKEQAEETKKELTFLDRLQAQFEAWHVRG